MRGLLVAGAPSTLTDGRLRSLVGEAGIVVAVDSGSHRLHAAGIVPDVVVGDLDSSDPDIVTALRELGVTFVRFPSEKDETDLLLALEWVRSQGVDKLDVVGVLGGRVDHELAALGDLVRNADLLPVVHEERFNVVFLAHGERDVVSVPEGSDLSVIALSSDAEVSIEGCRYPLDRATIEPLSGLGVSNVALADRPGTVRVHRGAVAVFSGDFD